MNARIDPGPRNSSVVDRPLEPERWPPCVAHGGESAVPRAGGLFAGEEVEIPDVGGPHRGDWHRRQHRVPVRIDQARHQHSSTAVDLHSMLAVAGVDGLSGDRLDRGAADEDIRAV